MDDIKKKILEAFIEDGILEEEATPIHEVKGYGWETSLVEAIEEYSYQEYLDEEIYLKGDQRKEYEIGDIVFVNKFYSPSSKRVIGDSGHRVLVITSKKDEDGIVHYRGFELSSQVRKSNRQGRYANNLYIEDYSSILVGEGPHKEAIIRVDDLVKFNSKDLSPTGSYKGRASNEFLQFVQTAYKNYRSGRSKDNFNMRWVVGEDIHDEH